MRQLFCAYTYFLFFLLFIIGFPVYSQNPCSLSFSGRIIDLDDGKELEGTFIIHKTDYQTQITNEHGSFKFTNLCNGSHQFIIRHVGCRDSIITID